MASNTITVSDGTGLQLLEQLNAVFPAVSSAQYGSTDPSVGGYAVAGMWWVDTGNNLVKQRNSANTAWITQGSFDATTGAITWNNATNATTATMATTATKATQDGNGNTISSTYLKLAGGTMTGALNLANNTWNTMGDDVMIGDCNVSGCLGVKGNNATTGIALYQYGNTNYATLKYDGTYFVPSVVINGTCTNANNATNSNYATNAGNANTLGGYTYAQVIANAGSIASSSYGTTGYVKFNSGLTLIWAQSMAITKSDDNFTFTFPTSFTNSNYCIFGIMDSGTYVYNGLYQKNTNSFSLLKNITNLNTMIYNLLLIGN